MRLITLSLLLAVGLLIVNVRPFVAQDSESDNNDDDQDQPTRVRSNPVLVRQQQRQQQQQSGPVEEIPTEDDDRESEDGQQQKQPTSAEEQEDGDDQLTSAGSSSETGDRPAPPPRRQPAAAAVEQLPLATPSPRTSGRPFNPILAPGQEPSLTAPVPPGANLANVLSQNPSLLGILRGLGSQGLTQGLPPGLAASLQSSLSSSQAGPAPSFGSGIPGGFDAVSPPAGGLLAAAGLPNIPNIPNIPSLSSLPNIGGPPPFPGAPGGGLPAGPPGTDNGLLNVISSLGRQLGGAVGLNNLIPGSSAVGPSIPRISGLGGPPIAGIPTIPGLPVFPGAITPGGQLDVLQLISAVSRRALNGSTVTDVIQPNQVQKLADNLTDTLLPETPIVDLTKYMGRWFEGIGSPRATDQRCVVHHYGGLTENGKTATFTALKIYREGSEIGQVRYSIGYAFRGGRQEGMLQMHTSESSDPLPYWIYKVGPTSKDAFGNDQYDYAIVSNWIKYPVVVLVRDPDRFKKEHEESVLRWLEEKGFVNGFVRAFNLVQPVNYHSCQYADSTFELFG